MSAIQTNFYDQDIYFRLSYVDESGYLIQEEVIEPMNWSEVKNRIPRDPKWLGFTSDFIEDNFGLLFTFIKDLNGTTGGGETLRYIANTIGLGPNHPVYFEIGNKKGMTFLPIKKWRVNLQEYECDDKGVATSIEKMPFQAKLRARMSSICSINSYQGVDGEVLTKIPTYTGRLHSRMITERSRSQSVTFSRSNEYYAVLGHTNNLNMQLDSTNIQIDELKTLNNAPCALINRTGNPSSLPQVNIYDDFLFQYKAATSGFLTVEVSGSGNFWLWHNNRQLSPAGAEFDWGYFARIVVQRFDGGTWVETVVASETLKIINSASTGYDFTTPPEDVLASVTGTSRANSNKVPLTWNLKAEDVNIVAGDNVYVHINFFTGGTTLDGPLVIQIDNVLSDLQLKQDTITPQSTANGFRIFDVLTQLLENITGQKNAVVSPFFEEGGQGYKYLLMNGYSIRNADGLKFTFKKDLESLLDDLRALFFIGIGFKEINGVDIMHVDYAPEFFKDRLIAEYPECYNFKDLISQEYSYNEITLGYTKYEGLNINQNDDFCTEAQYLIQTTKIQKSAMSAKCGLVASSLLIELQRRNQFLLNPGQTLTNDEVVFIIATSDSQLVLQGITTAFGAAVSRVIFYKRMNMAFGDSFVVGSGAVGNVGVKFTISGNVPGFPRPVIGFPGLYEDAYNITPAPVDAVPYSTALEIYTSSPDQIFCERDEIFQICTNIADPSSIYNGRLSLKQILYNWRPMIGVSLYFVNPENPDYRFNKIITSRSKLNSLFTHKYLSTEEFKGNVGDKTIVELRDETISDYLSIGDSIFNPMVSTFMVRAGWNDVEVVRRALCGETGNPLIDFGGISVIDDFGQKWFCQVMDMFYNRKSEMIEYKVRKIRRIM